MFILNRQVRVKVNSRQAKKSNSGRYANWRQITAEPSVTTFLLFFVPSL